MKKYPKTLISLIAILFIATTLQWKPSLSNWFYIIDDHEIISLSKKAETESFSELISKTEIFRYGETKRFRPVYFFLRILEIKFWSTNPLLWQTTRIFIYVFFIFTFFLYFIKTKEEENIDIWLLKTSAFLFLVSAPMWTDIITRFGTSETYTILGISLLILAFLNKKEKIRLLLTLVGGTICIGSKENFVILPLIIYILCYKNEKYKSIKLANHLLSLLSIFVLFGFLPAIISKGEDVYTNKVNVLDRLLFLFKNYKFHLTHGFLILSTFLSIKGRNKALSIANTIALGINLFFYAGYIGPLKAGRYYFPTIIICLSIFYDTIHSFIDIIKTKIKTKQYVTLISVIIFITLALAFKNARDNYVFSENKKVITKNFKSNFEKLKSVLTPGTQVLFTFQTPLVDYEPIISLQKFTKSYIEGLDFYIVMSKYSYTQKSTPLNKKLIMLMEKRAGNDPKEVFINLSNIKKEKPCVQIFIRNIIKKDSAIARCKAIILDY